MSMLALSASARIRALKLRQPGAPAAGAAMAYGPAWLLTPVDLPTRVKLPVGVRASNAACGPEADIGLAIEA
jgi:hypothetical protein